MTKTFFISIFPEDIDLTGNGEFFEFEVMKYKCKDSQKYAILCNGFCLINSDEIESENFDINEWIKIDFMVLEVYQGDITEFLLNQSVA